MSQNSAETCQFILTNIISRNTVYLNIVNLANDNRKHYVNVRDFIRNQLDVVRRYIH